MTDVLAGLAMGALVERCLRPLSKGAIRSDIEARQASVHARTAATNRTIEARHGTVMTLIVIALVTVLLLLMFKPTRIPVLVILGRFSWSGCSQGTSTTLADFCC